jgi:hypothetical protein
VLNLDAIEAAAKAAMTEQVSTPFLQKTNSECAEWMRSFYKPSAIPRLDRHCTWAWQEQERRHAPMILELVRRLRAAEALAASRIEQIPVDAKVVSVFYDFTPDHQDQAEEFAEAIKKRCTSGRWTLVAFFPVGASITALNDEQLREAGLALADKSLPIQEAWEAAGGNPDIKATREELISALRMMDEAEDESEQKAAEQKGKMLVDAAALRQVLQALNGPGHHIRELQVCRGLPDSPIEKLVAEFNAQAGG